MKKAVSLLMVLLLLSFAPAMGDTQAALTVNGQTVSFAEVWIYILDAERKYADIEAYYEDFLGIDYWNLEYANGMTVAQMVKSDVFKEILMMNVFYGMAVDLKLALTDEEKRLCLEDARSHYQSLPVNQASQIDVTDLATVFEKQLLADRVYSMLLGSIAIDESKAFEKVDAEKYVTYEIEYLFCQKTDFTENGASIPLTQEKREMIVSALRNAKNAESLSEEAKKLSSIGIFFAQSRFVSGEENIDPTLYQAVQALSPGETSDVIETDYGLFLVRLISNSDQSALNAAIDEAIYQMRVSAFQESYDELYSGAEYEINVSFWDSLTVGEQIPEINTHSHQTGGQTE
ncbi:MAG: peptidyl-prolyl cis-trans isomerase [Clostridia bacterium]|nr:peptidyl-prolyl cis-trans isomerase [Clostridia bacterium]